MSTSYVDEIHGHLPMASTLVKGTRVSRNHKDDNFATIDLHHLQVIHAILMADRMWCRMTPSMRSETWAHNCTLDV